MKTCDQCGKKHKRKRFCSNDCKDIYHNIHNPRGYGKQRMTPNERSIKAGLDGMEDGWDGHKGTF